MRQKPRRACQCRRPARRRAPGPAPWQTKRESWPVNGWTFLCLFGMVPPGSEVQRTYVLACEVGASRPSVEGPLRRVDRERWIETSGMLRKVMLPAETGLSQVPAAALPSDAPMSRQFRGKGFCTLADAARAILVLPYARARSANSILDEARGTCSTKNAAFVLLAREAGFRADLVVDFFMMSEANTPGVGCVLEEEGLSCVLEAHCSARLGNVTVDLTGLEGTSTMVVQRVLLEPGRLEEKALLHREQLKEWGKGYAPYHTSDELWMTRERCIEALSQKGKSN